MEDFVDVFTNKYVYIPLLLWFFIQLFKVIWDLVVDKKFDFKRVLGAGGMPSSHSAVVCALAVMIGKEVGFDSCIFALSLLFAIVVMYDACGVRRAAGKQAKMLNKIISTPGLTGVQVQEKLVEVLGHTPVQVLVGALIGIIVGIIM